MEEKIRGRSGILRLYEAYRAAVKDFEPDVIHLHSTFAGIAGRLMPVSSPKTAIVYCSHGWAFLREDGWLASNFYGFVEWLLSHRSHAIINISKNEERAARRYFLASSKMSTILNGVSEAKLKNERAAPLRADKINLLFVGRHDRQKGLDIALDAMSRISRNDMHLHVLGASVLAESSLAASVGANVTMHGWCERNEVMAFMRSADVVVMPSRWEGFGLVAVEAMSVGTPVVASRRGALEEIVEDGVSGWLYDGAVAGLVSVLESIDRSSLGQLGHAARLRYLEHFGSDRMSSEISALYVRTLRRIRPDDVPSRSTPANDHVAAGIERSGGQGTAISLSATTVD